MVCSDRGKEKRENKKERHRPVRVDYDHVGTKVLLSQKNKRVRRGRATKGRNFANGDDPTLTSRNRLCEGMLG